MMLNYLQVNKTTKGLQNKKMQLKKINLNLQQALIENDFQEANEIQFETFSTIKSGSDVVVEAPNSSGKSTTIVINVIQRIEKAIGESSRALVLVKDKDKVIEMVELFNKLSTYTDLRVFGVHDKGNFDFDKNHISLGNDIIVGTTSKINALFSSAGFNINTIKMFVVDDADELFRSRLDAVIMRLSASIEKTQRIFFTTNITERVEILAEKIMIEPVFFEME